jgi:hypothetical protein
MIIPHFKIADTLAGDWSERYPKGTRVIIGRFKVAFCAPFEQPILYAHICDPPLDHGHGIWLAESWFTSYKRDPKPRS